MARLNSDMIIYKSSKRLSLGAGKKEMPLERGRASTVMKKSDAQDKDDDVRRSVSSHDQLHKARNTLSRPDSQGKMSTTSSRRARGQRHRDFKITTKH